VSVNAKFAPLAVKAQKPRTVVTASALPLIAEIAAVGPEIAEVAVTCTLITLVGLAIGFVLLRVEAAVEGQE
jgi:phage-related baseplate assembly protein